MLKSAVLATLVAVGAVGSTAQAGFSSGSRRAMSSTSPRRRRRRSPASMVRTPPPTRAAGRRRVRGAGSWQSRPLLPLGSRKEKTCPPTPRSWHLRYHAHQGKQRAAVRAWACGHGRGAGPWPCKLFLKAKPRTRRKKHGANSETKAERKKREKKARLSPVCNPR